MCFRKINDTKRENGGRKWERKVCKFGTQQLVLAIPDLRQPFEIEMDAVDYAMGAFLMQHHKPISFHSELLMEL